MHYNDPIGEFENVETIRCNEVVEPVNFAEQSNTVTRRTRAFYPEGIYVVLFDACTRGYFTRSRDGVLPGVVSECVVPIDELLLGNWVSDAKRTVEMMPASTDKGSEAFHTTRRRLGKIKISFSRTEMEIMLDGESDRISLSCACVG
ncbi:MAG: hypothetical protein Aurels2KO_51950 [Aureliella sp.]